ncbi:unnamed protein product [Symbiodinium sp. CCMP2592]|nr:unnamed protein product [Symbiodinium sp. CCMP2592]
MGLQAFRMHSNLVSYLKPLTMTPRRPRKSKKVDASNAAEQKPTPAKKTDARLLLDSASLCLLFEPTALVAAADGSSEVQDGAVPVDSEDKLEAEHPGAKSGWLKRVQKLLHNAAPVKVDEQRPGPASEKPESHWVHVGYMNHRSYVLSWVPLLPDGSHPQRNNDALKNLRVPEEAKCYRSFEFFQDRVDSSIAWTCTIYKVYASTSPPEHVVPSEARPSMLSVIRYADVPRLDFWKGSAAEDEARKRPSTGHGKGPGGPGPPGGTRKRKAEGPLDPADVHEGQQGKSEGHVPNDDMALLSALQNEEKGDGESSVDGGKELDDLEDHQDIVEGQADEEELAPDLSLDAEAVEGDQEEEFDLEACQAEEGDDEAVDPGHSHFRDELMQRLRRLTADDVDSDSDAGRNRPAAAHAAGAADHHDDDDDGGGVGDVIYYPPGSADAEQDVAGPANPLPAEPVDAEQDAEADHEAEARVLRAVPVGGDRIRIARKGFLVHYPAESCLVAVCLKHKDCRKKRTLLAGRRGGQGRCLGFLMAWLNASADYDSQQSHVNAFTTTLQARREGRAEFMRLPNAADWAAKEQGHRAEGDTDEPTRFV